MKTVVAVLAAALFTVISVNVCADEHTATVRDVVAPTSIAQVEGVSPRADSIARPRIPTSQADVGDWIGRWETADRSTNSVELTFRTPETGTLRYVSDGRFPCFNVNIPFTVESNDQGDLVLKTTVKCGAVLVRVGPKKFEGKPPTGRGFRILYLEKR